MSNLGLTPVRTARTISAVIALMGMLLLFIQRVLAAVLVMANEAISLGLARYNNFTGRFAAQNFAEDKKLLGLLKDVQGILPMADTAVVVLLVVSIVFLVVALLGLALPRQFVHVLVALKILKWKSEADEEVATATDPRAVIENIGNIPLKKLAIPVGIILAVVIAGFGISNCVEKVEKNSVEGSLNEMQEHALLYIGSQKEFFAKKKAVGGAKDLNLPDSASTEAFDFKISATRFSAVSKIPLGDCPAGSRWQVVASTKGLFSVELSLYRGVPKDSSCAVLTPDFKNLGRKGK